MAIVDYGGAVLPHGTKVPIGAYNYTIAPKPSDPPKSLYVPASEVYKDKQTFDPKVLSTPKFGDLVLDGSEFSNAGTQLLLSKEELASWDKPAGTAFPEKATNLTFQINGSYYTFHPSNILEKGFVADKKQWYNTRTLKNLDKVYEEGQPISLKGVGWYDDFLKKNDLSTEGVLMPAGFTNAYLGAFGDWRIQDVGYEKDNLRWNEITGIGKVGDQYVYTANVNPVDGTSASGYYDASGSGYGEWAKEKGGFLGSLSRAIAKVPFLPEVAGLATSATGAGPYVYATLKGLQGGAAGEDPLKVGLKTGATILAADLASDVFGGAPTEAAPVGGTPGVSEVFPVDMSVGGTVTQLPPLEAGLPSYGLLDGVTFPGQGLQVPGISSPDISLLPSGTALPGQGLVLPTMPGIPALGGAQGLTVGVPGGTVGQGGFTPTGATPVLGDPGSFINDPDVLGRPVIEPVGSTISLNDAFRAARTINSLMGAGGEQPGAPQRQDLGQMQPTGVDTLMLPQFTAGVPNIAGLLNPMPYRGPYFDIYTGLPSLLG
jgi:hypothetical protein